MAIIFLQTLTSALNGNIEILFTICIFSLRLKSELKLKILCERKSYSSLRYWSFCVSSIKIATRFFSLTSLKILIKYVTSQNIFGVCKASRTCLQAISRSLKEVYRKKRLYQLTMYPVIEVQLREKNVSSRRRNFSPRDILSMLQL